MTDGTIRPTTSPSLDRLRADAMAYPSHGAEQIRYHLTAVDDPGLRTDLTVLLAETYQRQGLIRAALETIADAQLLQAGLPPYGPRFLTTLAVNADLAVFDARPDAPPACRSYLDAAIQAVPSNGRRVLLADALHAVAVYHHSSCVAGLTQLTMLTATLPAADGIAATMRHGVAAMTAGCRTGRQLQWTRLPPVLPGGLLRPDLDTSPCDYLASRVIRHTPAHTCVFDPTRLGRTLAHPFVS